MRQDAAGIKVRVFVVYSPGLVAGTFFAGKGAGAVRIFISGGCKNGKSSHAQRLARQQRAPGKPLYYLATMTPKDVEDIERIRRHRRERSGLGFETVEVSGSPRAVIGRLDPSGSALLDSVTALLSDAMFPAGGTMNMEAHVRLERELLALLETFPNIVLVSDGIYSDAWRYESLTEAYRRHLAWLDRSLARACDVVLEAAFGNLVVFKGDLHGEGWHADHEGILDVDGNVFRIPRT